MVTDRILRRTFFIKAERYGTAFTVDVEGEEFLVTAKHLLDESVPELTIKIFHNFEWHDIRAEVIGHTRGEADISVLRLPRRLTPPDLPVMPTISGLAVGQDVHFLGFPYKMWSNVGDMLGGMPCPFVKRGTASAYQLHNPQILHIDAINNEGFSGGPVVFLSSGDPTSLRIAGVVSKFRVEFEKVIDANGEETQMTVPYNTGFLIAYGSKYILDLIAAYKAAQK